MPVERVPYGIGRRFRRKPSGKRPHSCVGVDAPSPMVNRCPWKNATTSLWTRQLQAEEYSRKYGYKLSIQPIAHERERQKTIRGPGYYDIPFETYKKSRMPNEKSFGTSSRLAKVINDNPSPGTYLPDIFQHSSIMKKSITKTPTFEWNGFQDRFRPVVDETWKPTATRYFPKDAAGIDALLKKRVSRRGPYDMFTGPRDNSTIKNHFSVKSGQGVDKFYAPCSDIDYLLKHPAKRRNGVVYRKTTRMQEYTVAKEARRHSVWTMKHEFPGPATYDTHIHGIKTLPPGKAPFCTKAVTHTTAETCAPGPGRYFLNTIAPPSMKSENVKSKYRKFVKKLDRKLQAASSMRLIKYASEDGLTLSKHRKVKHHKLNPCIIKASTDTTFVAKAETKRVKELFNYHFWHVVPRSIERALLQHPAVQEVVIIGFPQELDDDHPFALVLVSEEYADKVTEKDLVYFVNQKLAYREKIRGGVRIVKSSPKLVTGKSSKSLVAEVMEFRL